MSSHTMDELRFKIRSIRDVRDLVPTCLLLQNGRIGRDTLLTLVQEIGIDSYRPHFNIVHTRSNVTD